MEKGQKLKAKELDHQVRDQMSLTKPFKTYNYQEEQKENSELSSPIEQKLQRSKDKALSNS